MSAAASAHAPSKFRLLLVGATTLALVAHGVPVASAQSSIFPNGLSVPVYRGTRGAPHFPQDAGFGAARGLLPPPHLDPVGKPCLEIFPVATAQISNRDIHDHNLLMNNRCSQRIKLSICYYQTRTCSELAVAGYTRQLKLFGIFPEKDFRIEYREYVD
jgi:hypothetical protein